MPILSSETASILKYELNMTGEDAGSIMRYKERKKWPSHNDEVQNSQSKKIIVPEWAIMPSYRVLDLPPLFLRAPRAIVTAPHNILSFIFYHKTDKGVSGPSSQFRN